MAVAVITPGHPAVLDAALAEELCKLCGDAVDFTDAHYSAHCGACGKGFYHQDCFQQYVRTGVKLHGKSAVGHSTTLYTCPAGKGKTEGLPSCKGKVDAAHLREPRNEAKKARNIAAAAAGVAAKPAPKHAPAKVATGRAAQRHYESNNSYYYTQQEDVTALRLHERPVQVPPTPATVAVQAPGRGEPLVRKRLPKAKPPPPADPEAIRAAVRAAREELAAGGKAAQLQQQPLAGIAAPAAAVRHKKLFKAVNGLLIERPVKPAAPLQALVELPALAHKQDASVAGVDRVVNTLARYNQLLGLVDEHGSGSGSFDEEIAADGLVEINEMPSEGQEEHVHDIAGEQLYHTDDGRLVTLAEYAAMYGVTVEQLRAMYPDTFGDATNAQVPQQPLQQEVSQLSAAEAIAEEEEAESDDVADLIALCLN